MLRTREGEHVAFVCWECDGVIFWGFGRVDFYMLLAAWALGTFLPNKVLNNVSNKIQDFKLPHGIDN